MLTFISTSSQLQCLCLQIVKECVEDKSVVCFLGSPELDIFQIDMERAFKKETKPLQFAMQM